MIYDISQPLFECEVFTGDPKPVKTAVRRIENGDLYNLAAISMCVHNGTHIDAPFYFLNDGKGVNRIPLKKFIGAAYVATHEGDAMPVMQSVFLKKSLKLYEVIGFTS